jgi:hypothetical protein
MNNDPFPQVEIFQTQLQKLGNDFICNNQLPDSVAYVSFLGTLYGKTVLWNMNLATLAHIQANTPPNTQAIKSEIQRRPFIEIKEGSESIYALSVGLDLKEIDVPVIKKTIIMIRNYKLLDIGMIEFGSVPT